jgi:hypothetical protein
VDQTKGQCRQHILVLDGDGIEWSIVNTQAEGFIVLLHKQGWQTQGDDLGLM